MTDPDPQPPAPWSADAPPPPTGRPTGRLRRGAEVALGTGLAALIVIGLAVALVVTTNRLHHDDALNQARATALQAGQAYAVDLTTYDYRHLDESFGLVLAHSSPTFKRSFTASSNALRSLLSKYDATAKATVVAAGVTSASVDQAVVLVFLTQTVTNTAQKNGPTTDQSRVSMTLDRLHGQWVIDQVRLL